MSPIVHRHACICLSVAAGVVYPVMCHCQWLLCSAVQARDLVFNNISKTSNTHSSLPPHSHLIVQCSVHPPLYFLPHRLSSVSQCSVHPPLYFLPHRLSSVSLTNLAVPNKNTTMCQSNHMNIGSATILVSNLGSTFSQFCPLPNP